MLPECDIKYQNLTRTLKIPTVSSNQCSRNVSTKTSEIVNIQI